MSQQDGQLWRPMFERGNIAQGPYDTIHPHVFRGMKAAYEPEAGIQGRRLIDLSGSGNHSTFASGMGSGAYVPNAPRGGNYAVNFDNVDDEIQIGTGSILDISQDYTIACWVNINSVASNSYTVVGAANLVSPGTGSYFLFLHRADKAGMCLQIQNAPGTVTLGPNALTNLTVGKWHHCVAVHWKTGGQASIYQDGRFNLIGTYTLSSVAFTNGNTQVWGYGCWNPLAGGNRFNGKLGAMQIWNRALTAEEIRYVYDTESLFYKKHGIF